MIKTFLRRCFTTSSIQIIDGLYQGIPGRNGCYVLQENDDLLFVDPGVNHSLPQIEKYIESNGLSFTQLKYVVVSHAHLDHCGSVGRLLEKSPDCQVICHPNAVPILEDPRNLVTGTKKTYGEDYFEANLGPEVLAVDSKFLTMVDHGEAIEFGERELTFYHSTAHTKHHVMMHDNKSKGMFVGDSVGFKYLDIDGLVPCYPGEALLSTALETIDLIESLGVDEVFLAHFGGHKNVEELLAVSAENFKYFAALSERIFDDLVVNKEEEEVIISQLREELFDSVYLSNDSLEVNAMISSKGLVLATQKRIWRHAKEFIKRTRGDVNVRLVGVEGANVFFEQISSEGDIRRETLSVSRNLYKGTFTEPL